MFIWPSFGPKNFPFLGYALNKNNKSKPLNQDFSFIKVKFISSVYIPARVEFFSFGIHGTFLLRDQSQSKSLGPLPK